MQVSRTVSLIRFSTKLLARPGIRAQVDDHYAIVEQRPPRALKLDERHLGLTTLRAMGYAEADGNFQRLGNRGQTSTQIVVLSEPIRSWIYLPVGQSDRPDSPHFDDQARTVFSDRTLKPSWWTPEELKDHISSREELRPQF